MNKSTNNMPVIYSLDTHMLEPPERYGHILLVQLSDITAQLGWTVEAHAQYCQEIIFILEGEAVMGYNGQRFNIQAGQMVIVPEDVIHDVRYVSPGHTRMLLAGIRMDDEIDPWIRSVFTQLMADDSAKLRTYPQNLRVLFDMLIDEYFHRDEHSHQTIVSLLQVLLVQCCRQFSDSPREPHMPLAVNATSDLLTSQLCQYIRHHAVEMTSLDELSREFSYSYSYLSHHFKKVAGYSIKDYWDHYRFAHVLQLMRDPSISITEISERLHYQSIHTFSRSFRSKFGMSPSEFRKMLME